MEGRNTLRFTTRLGFGLALCFFTLTPLSASADSGVFASVTLDGYSEPEPLMDTLEEWGESFDKGERQWLLNEFEIGYRLENGLSIAAFQRGLASTRINEQAAQYYGRIERNQPLTDASVPIELTVSGFTGQGARFGYVHRRNRWSASAEVSVFETKYLMDGGLSGTLTTNADGSYHIAADVDYRYYRDSLFNRPDIDRPTGVGHALDLQLDYRVTDRWQLSLQAEDVWAAIEWERTPYTIASANSQRQAYDDEGFVSFNPLFEGTEGYRENYQQDIEPRYRLSSKFQSGDWSFNTHLKHQFGTLMPVLGIARRWRSSTEWELSYDLERRALGLGLSHNRWVLEFATDALELENAQALYLTLNYNDWDDY